MQGVTYSVDVVLCIDVTASMSSIIEKVKGNALRFYDDLTKVLEAKEKTLDKLRIKVISFRDYFDDASNAMKESPFYALPEDKDSFFQFVNYLTASGGGDAPESGLEAIALAIQSDWMETVGRRRQIIVLWTDAPAHPLNAAKTKPAEYPNNLPATFDELTDLWEGQRYMIPSAKRIILYAPDTEAWTMIANHWEHTIHYPSRAGEGLSDVDYSTILDAIANSV